MTKRQTNSIFMAVMCFIFFALAQIAQAQAQKVSDWIPQPVEVKNKDATKASKNLGKPTVNVRSSASLNSQTLATENGKCLGARTLTSNAPVPNTPLPDDFIIGACCDCNRILLDGLMIYQNVTLDLFNSTPNSTVPVTLGHSGPGRIGFALNVEGPYVDSLVFNVNTNSSGNGSLVITFHIKGLDAGQSNMTTTVSSGFTNPVPQMEVFACQCPPVP